jgi:hypothetical protein
MAGDGEKELLAADSLRRGSELLELPISSVVSSVGVDATLCAGERPT